MPIIKDLISTPQGKVSHTKFWSNIAYATGTAVIVITTFKENLTSDLFLIYLSVVGGAAIASKFVSLRYGGGKDDGSPNSGM